MASRVRGRRGRSRAGVDRALGWRHREAGVRSARRTRPRLVGNRRVVRRRAVRPVDDPDSNEGMARAVLLDRVGPAPHPIDGRCRRHRRRGRARLRHRGRRGAADRHRAPRSRARRPHRIALPRFRRARGDRPPRGHQRRRPPPAPAAHVHLSRAGALRGSSSSPWPATTSATRSPASAPATTCPRPTSPPTACCGSSIPRPRG